MAFLLFISSCGAIVKSVGLKQITVENNAIPPDFGKDESYLICVLSGKNSYDKYLKKHVINEYHGKYEFVLEENLYDKKYRDSSKYRFVFNRNITSSSYGGSSAGGGQSSVPTNSFFIIDNKEHKTYESPMTSGMFAKVIQVYMINLEKERLKYQ
jgi:hypothetical protein